MDWGPYLSMTAPTTWSCPGKLHLFLLSANSHPSDFTSFYRNRVRSLAMLVAHSLTHSCLVNLIDVTLACEDANSKLVDVVTVGKICFRFRSWGKKTQLLFTLRAQGLVKILKFLQLESGQFFFCWCFVEVLKLNLGRDCEARSGQDFEA